MEGTLKVSPERLIATAESMSNEASQLTSLADQMSSIASSLQSGWEGEAAMAYINKINEEKNDINDCVQKVRARLQELQQMAQNYTSAESTNESTAEGLAVDVVQI